MKGIVGILLWHCFAIQQFHRKLLRPFICLQLLKPRQCRHAASGCIWITLECFAAHKKRRIEFILPLGGFKPFTRHELSTSKNHVL